VARQRIYFTVATVLTAAGIWVASTVGHAAPTAPATQARAPVQDAAAAHPRALPRRPASPSPHGYLAPGSNPAVLPGSILIADKGNNRLLIVDPHGRVLWSWPSARDLRAGQSFRIPDDAFFTPDGHRIVVTQEDDFAITVVDVGSRRIVWRYGHPGVHGSSAGYLWNPDDAMQLRSGVIVAADIKNCRLIQIPAGGSDVSWQRGRPGACWHKPPYTYGAPNGVFPLRSGGFLVTEIHGDWVDQVTASGERAWSAHPPGVAYPSDTSQVGPNAYLTVDYSKPGQVVTFDRSGRTLWRYRVWQGSAALNHPSLATMLPNGDVLLNDDFNDRVIVIDPRTNRIVWQYGHTGVPGRAAGYLHTPDGLDSLPPFSYADRFSH
jgi:DNA-binding beta-propeller fold protein YncE